MPKRHTHTKRVLLTPNDSQTNSVWSANAKHHSQTNTFCFANNKYTNQTNTSCFRNKYCMFYTYKETYFFKYKKVSFKYKLKSFKYKRNFLQVQKTLKIGLICAWLFVNTADQLSLPLLGQACVS